MINNYRTSINVDKSKLEEIDKFIGRVEKFAKNILPKMGDDVKAFLDISEIVGHGTVATLYIYGYRDMYDDEFEFGRVHNEDEMKSQVGSIIKSFIGKPSVISASTFWTAKKKLGRKTQEIGPYVCVEFDGDSVYESVQALNEFKKVKINNNTYTKLSYALDSLFDSMELKKINAKNNILTEIGVRVSKDDTKAINFLKDFNFDRVLNVGAHSQDKPSEDELDFLLTDIDDIVNCLDYIAGKSGEKRIVTFVNENSSRKVFEAKESILSKEDEKELEKTLLKIFKVHYQQ